ncbi:MAG: hypothetical protein Q8R34_01935 [bacterium]|nr:hypothetical protein [bacterium]
MDIIPYVVLAYAVLIGCILLIISNKQKISHWIKAKKNRVLPDDNWDTAEKLKEMKEIETESFGALGSIRFFLNDPYVTYQFLKETVVSEFNKHAPIDEQIPPDLPEKKMRQEIIQKAEEYHLTKSPLLEVLADSFIARTR